MQASSKKGRYTRHLAAFAILGLPILMAGGCPSLTVTVSGDVDCDGGEVAAGSSITITATATDADGMDVTGSATYTYEVTSGSQSITVTGQNNTATATVPTDADEGAATITVTGELDGLAASADCNIVVGPPAPCTTDADCDDGDACTDDACGDSGCENTATDCDDGLDCTDDSCDSASGCANTDNCPEGQSCNADTGDCADCGSDADCDDGDACTDDACVDGACESTDTDCDDGLDCTDDSCDSADGCANDNNCAEATPICTADGCVECESDADCDTDNGETCTDGSCGGGPCDDDNPCVDDGLFCNGVDQCTDGECVSDGDPCADFDCGGDDPICLEGDNDATCECPPRDAFEFTLGTDNLLGTSDDDTFLANLEFNQGSGTQVATLQTGDSANGLAGDDDMSATFGSSGATVVPTSIEGIEDISISDFGSGTTTLNAINVSGCDSITSSSSTTRLGVANLTGNPTIGFNGTTVGGIYSYNQSVTTGTDDILTVSLTGSQITGIVTVIPGAANGFETGEIWSNTSANILGSLVQGGGSTSMDTINGYGDSNLELRLSPTSVKTYDFSNMTGGGVTLGTGDGTNADAFVALNAGANLNSITGSPGPDRIIMGTTLNANDAAETDEFIDLGDDEDFLQATLAGTIGGVLPIVNVETLGLNATATSQLNMTGVTGVTDVINYEDGTAHAITLLNLGATNSVFPNLHYRGDGQNAAQTYDTITYQPSGASGSGDTLNIFVANANSQSLGSSNSHTVGAITAPTLENIVFDCADGSCVITTGITASTATNATFTASNNLNAGTLSTGGTDSVLSINAGGVTGNFTVTCNDMASANTVTAGGGNDSITIGDSGSTSSVVTLGSGTDTFTSTDTDSQDVISGGDGNDTITGGGGNDTVTTGSGEDDVVINQTTANNRSDISDFTAGTGGDEVVFDITAMGLAGGTEYVGVIGSLAVNGSEEIAVLTVAGYATDDAAEDAVAARVTTDGLDIVYLYFNTTTNTTHIVYEADSGLDDADGTAVLVGTLSNITSQASHDTLVAANLNSQ